MTIGIIYGGTREGNTEMLAHYAVQELAAEKIYLRDYSIHSIVDQRHILGGFQNIGDDYNSIIDRILQHDILIFVTPIYWYSMSGTMKNFIDRWSQSLRDTNYSNFKASMSAKKAFVIAVGGDNPYVKGLPLIQQFQHIFDFMGMSFDGYVLGEGNKPGDIRQDEAAILAAQQLNNKLKAYEG
ncbi:flavodoxin family protein [Scopulibacillus darangshiensis]|nr:flavodoxin family protein [Scopulibacillus darangshiensis]